MWGVTPFSFCRDLRHQKTRVPGLLCGVVCVILCLAVSAEHRLVTDTYNTNTIQKQFVTRRLVLAIKRNGIGGATGTDRQTHDDGIYRASMASRGK